MGPGFDGEKVARDGHHSRRQKVGEDNTADTDRVVRGKEGNPADRKTRTAQQNEKHERFKYQRSTDDTDARQRGNQTVNDVGGTQPNKEGAGGHGGTLVDLTPASEREDTTAEKNEKQRKWKQELEGARGTKEQVESRDQVRREDTRKTKDDKLDNRNTGHSPIKKTRKDWSDMTRDERAELLEQRLKSASPDPITLSGMMRR